ncbi:MAG: hypothetical protein BRD51_02445, partial [Bacteroidetes bacterium SW_11_64_17]
LTSLNLKGFRPFRNLEAEFGPLNVIIGANGSGKSSLFEFFQFLRDAVQSEIPPEVVIGSVGKSIFHSGGPEQFGWSLEVDTGECTPIQYQGELVGPISQKRVSRELVKTKRPLGENDDEPYVFMDVQNREGVVRNAREEPERQEIQLQRPNKLALSSTTNPKLHTLYELRNYISRWCFYSAFDINNRAIRKPTLTEPAPVVLSQDASNLSAVLFNLMTEHPSVFEKLERHMQRVVPGFKNLNVVPQGAKGEVIAQWDEGNVDEKLTLADLSDGILRLLCWMTLAVQPERSPASSKRRLSGRSFYSLLIRRTSFPSLVAIPSLSCASKTERLRIPVRRMPRPFPVCSKNSAGTNWKRCTEATNSKHCLSRGSVPP